MNPGRSVLLASILFAAPLLATPGFAQDDALRKDIEELKKGQREILIQLEELKKLVQSGSKPSGPDVAGKVFAIGDNPTRGPRTAKLTIVEFTDYQ